MLEQDTIYALATPSGSGAIGVIRISGPEAITICRGIFTGKDLEKQKGQSLLFGSIQDGDETIDEVLLSLFKAPHSYTGEHLVEISCHGSPYVLQKLMQLLMQKGARLANPGEFTMRAFRNGKMDLAQAEAVADLIASESKASHQLALNQMRGGFSKQIQALREELIHFAAMIELELDFVEEDVEFANRDDLKQLVDGLVKMISELIASFADGKVIKNGIPVAIVGKPNVGKSTLLNSLLNEDKAIVSDIAGTTRDSIEDEVKIGGISFRFIDTAGLRETDDVVENIGIQRALQMVEKALIVLYLVDAQSAQKSDVAELIKDIEARIADQDKQLIVLANKMDMVEEKDIAPLFPKHIKPIYISALNQNGLSQLNSQLEGIAAEKLSSANQVIVSNARHHQALQQALEALQRVQDGLSNDITGDFLAMDIRQSLHYLGEITGSIEIDRDILGHIFSSFCIGK